MAFIIVSLCFKVDCPASHKNADMEKPHASCSDIDVTYPGIEQGSFLRKICQWIIWPPGSMIREKSNLISIQKTLLKSLQGGNSMIKECRFWTKDGIAVIMRPETKEQLEQVLWMGRMWQINHLGNCGPDYAVEFARQHQIKYSCLMVMKV